MFFSNRKTGHTTMHNMGTETTKCLKIQKKLFSLKILNENSEEYQIHRKDHHPNKTFFDTFCNIHKKKLENFLL